MITDLPPEVGEKILDYCLVKDVINLACCSKAYRDAVQHLLWRAVRIPFQDFVSVPDVMFKNLEHTSSLCLLLSNNDNVDAEKSFNYGFNYMRLLNNICPEKLTNLNIKVCPTVRSYHGIFADHEADLFRIQDLISHLIKHSIFIHLSFLFL